MRKIRYKEPSETLQKMAEPRVGVYTRASVGMEKFVSEFYQIDIEKLIPYSKQARVIFDEEELLKLADTIKAHGVRQPLTIMKSVEHDGLFEVISGERRLRASKIAGLQKVPCIILDNVAHAEEIALLENIQRQDLHPIELSRSLREILDKKGWGGQKQLQSQIGLSPSQISELLKLSDLSINVQNLLLEKNVRGRDGFRKLFALPSDEERIKFILKSAEDSELKVKKKLNGSSSVSILRLSLQDEIIKVQSGGLKRMSHFQREMVKEKLLGILQELEEAS